MGIAITFEHEKAHVPTRMTEALAARVMGWAPPERARGYRNVKIRQLAHACLVAAGSDRGVDPRNAEQCISAALQVSRMAARSTGVALQGSSDFVNLLANALSIMVLPGYANARPAYRRIAGEVEFDSFRPHQFTRAGDAPAPLQVGENANYQTGAMSDSKESVTLATYGRIIGLSRAVLVNDDVGALRDLALATQRRLIDFEDSLGITMLTSGASANGPTLSDGAQLFATGHGNLAASGAAIDLTTLGAGIAALAKQASPDGMKLNAFPRYLLTSPDKVVIAAQYLSQLAPAYDAAARITPLADANLTGNAWYLVADPAELPTLIYGYLAGTGPRIEARAGFSFDGVEYKVGLDFAVGAVGWRGIYKNPGA